MHSLRMFSLACLLPAALAAAIFYDRPVETLGSGQSLGNLNTYVTLDRETNVANYESSVRRGFRESTNQRYYAFAWTVEMSASGKPASAIRTSFYPAHQQTAYSLGESGVTKTFFLPFEIGYLRAGHYLLERRTEASGPIQVRSALLLPAGSSVEPAIFKGWKYALIRYPGGGTGVLWGAASVAVLDSKAGKEYTELRTEYEWTGSDAFALSFLYSPGLDEHAGNMLLNAAFDINAPDAPNRGLHIFRVRHLLAESERAVGRYIDTAKLATPDPVINRANAWAKITQLRLQSEYRWGEAFSNNPPSDVVVGRDSMWYLMGSSYYAQAWSSKLLAFWFAHGLEASGKFTEYMTASQDPLFSDDYGLNINDNTPLLIIASRHYYSLTGDRGFLLRVYPSLLRSAEFIGSQRYAGENNHYGLVWCTSIETFVRGLFGWRNAIANYNLSGAVTEVNSEAYEALRAVSELAGAAGDPNNETRFKAAAEDLRQAINRYLRPAGDADALYYLNINPAGQIVQQDTADEVYPVLYGVAEQKSAQRILENLFTDRFFVTTPSGAGGFRSISAREKEYQPRADPSNYGLLGGVWPNLGLSIARAAALRGKPDLALKALDASALLTELPGAGSHNVVPGEFPEYFNGDDLKRRGMPLSSFVPGIFIWSSLESFLGISAHAAGMEVNPVLPAGWNWAAAAHIPYRGMPLTLLAIRDGRILYSTAPVSTNWQMVIAPPELQDRFRFEPETETFGIVLSSSEGRLEVIAAAADATAVRVVERQTGHEIARFPLERGAVARRALP